MSQTPSAVIVGLGPGLSSSIARRFAREGYALGLIARRTDHASQLAHELTTAGHPSLALSADATDEKSLSAAFALFTDRFAAPDVLIYNAGTFRPGGILELPTAALEESWRIGCLGAFHAARLALPKMLERGRGTLLFTGATASLRGSARFAGLAVAKFGLRALAQSIARELGPRNIHVAHIVIDGGIGNAGPTQLAPDAIAETYWQLHQQPPTAWTHEIDLRPAVEKF